MVVLRVPAIYILSKNKKTIKVFHLKIGSFTAMKYRSILHRRVIVMFVYFRVAALDMFDSIPVSAFKNNTIAHTNDTIAERIFKP